MTQARNITQKEIEELESVEKRIKSKKEYRRLQSVLLRAKFGMTAIEIAVILGIHSRTVEKHHERYFKEGLSLFTDKKPGPVPGSPLSTTEQEKVFFQELEEKAKKGELLKATQIKPLYEQLVGKTVGLTTIYNLLHRNDWSKQQPRPEHPKGDKEAQENFKKIA